MKKESKNKNTLINLNTLFYTILEIPKEFVCKRSVNHQNVADYQALYCGKQCD